jgi:hypothetical protein
MRKGSVAECAQCGATIIAPECGYQFEHAAYLSACELADAD